MSDITFFNAHPPFYVTFYCFLRLLPLPFQVTLFLNGPYKDSYIAMEGILCDDTMSERSKI